MPRQSLNSSTRLSGAIGVDNKLTPILGIIYYFLGVVLFSVSHPLSGKQYTLRPFASVAGGENNQSLYVNS